MSARWLVTLLLVACQREAPGPLECRNFALSVVGVTARDELRDPRVNQRVEEVTRQCLTEPYDRELLRCYELTGEGRACQYEFKSRQRLRRR